MDLDDLSDEELEEILEFVEYERRPYTVKERMNPFEELDDVEFTTRFRLSKPSVHMILQQIEGQLETIDVEEIAVNIDFDEEIQPEGVVQNNINNARDNLIINYFRGLVVQQ
ncbi:hypothetical protein JTB14_014350 [Gonioctena quinquepunctata]|nr:hypothetical protein JTB14_014350 [Gonioctena quinquepunctata]